MINHIEGQLGRYYAWEIVPKLGSGRNEGLHRHLQGEWLPVIVTSLEEDGVTYGQRSYVAPYDTEQHPNDPAWLNRKPLFVAELTVENTTDRPSDASIELSFMTDATNSQFAEIRTAPGSVVAENNGRLFALTDTSAIGALKTQIGGGVLTISGTLLPHSTARCSVLIPGWEITQDELASLRADDALVAQTEEYWRGLMASSAQVEIPDRILNNLIKASQVHCLIAGRNEDGKRIAPWIASINYGPLESEAQSVVRGMQFIGQSDFARRSHEYFAAKYNEEGFLCTGYTVMGTGWQLWCMGEYYALTRDKEWLAGLAPEMARVCRWIMAQREKTKKVDTAGNRVPEYGLAPPGAMADWEVFSYYFYANGYFYTGLKAAAEALADIDYPGAQEMLEIAAEYKDDIMRAFHQVQSLAPVFPLRDGTWVPEYPTRVYGPCPTNDLYPSEDFGRSWCYDIEIGAHHLVPMGVMDPKSQDVEWMMNHMEDVYFLADGMNEYPSVRNHEDWYNLGGFAKVQPYYARTVEVYALRDEVKPFIRSYFNHIPSLLNPEDLALWEHFHCGAFNKTHETGYFLYQTRTMLLTERGNELWLAPFVTGNWLEDGMTVGVRNAPTRFGEVSYRITSHTADGFIEAEIESPTRNAPESIVLRLRHPDGKRMASVTVNGLPWTDFDAEQEVVHLTPGAEVASVKVQY